MTQIRFFNLIQTTRKNSREKKPTEKKLKKHKKTVDEVENIWYTTKCTS